MSDGISIVNLGELAKPATVLIEKVSNAVGILYEPRKIVRKAEAEAQAERIKALAGIELTEIQQRGIERLVYQEARKQKNIEDITAQAATSLPSSAKAEELEDDWIAYFFGKCESVSDKHMQSLWSSLLAGEATTPGTFSKRTVDFVASMDRKDAELFTNLCQFTWMVGVPIPLIFDVSDEIYKKNKIRFADLKHLDSIGLISYDPVAGYRRGGMTKDEVAFYFGRPTLLEFDKEKDNEVAVGGALYTKTGYELVTICGAKGNQEFYEYSIQKLVEQGICLSSRLPVISTV